MPINFFFNKKNKKSLIDKGNKNKNKIVFKKKYINKKTNFLMAIICVYLLNKMYLIVAVVDKLMINYDFYLPHYYYCFLLMH